jgi:dTDP-4-dehydrorhamnose reductase
LIVRSGWLYGVRKGFINSILKVAELGTPFKVVTDEVGQPTAAHDLGRGIVALIEIGATGVVHVANTGGTSRFELARSILALAGHDPARVVPTTQAEFGRPARRPPDSRLDTTRFAKLTGQSLRPHNEVLAEHLAARLAAGAGRASSPR